jgi:hypothetical protein
METRLFLNPELDEAYRLNGFVKISFADTNTIRALKSLFDQYCPDPSHSNGQVFYSMFANSLERNLKLSDEIKQLLQPSYKITFVNYQSLAELFLTKQPDNEPLMLHQDWSYVHEDVTPAATVWLPLQNTTKQNGALFFIPGSHLFFKNYRSGSLPASRIPMDKDLKKYTVTVEVNEGEAIIFHQALFHGSHPNTGKENRIVAASIIIPENEELLYFHQPQNTDLLHTHSLTESEFFENLQQLSKGETFKNIKTLSTTSYHHQTLSGAQLCEEIEKERHHAV